MTRAGKHWERLAVAVRDRRLRMGITSQQALADAAKVSLRTVGNLERGLDVSYTTLGRIEAVLDWAPGSAATILSGGDPRPAAGPALTAERRPILDLEPERLIEMALYIEDVFDRETAQAFLGKAMRMREAAGRTVVEDERTAG